MRKCDWCKNDADCRGVERSECIVRDYMNFSMSQDCSKNPHKAKLMALLRGHSIDTEEDVEYVADMLLRNGVIVKG